MMHMSVFQVTSFTRESTTIDNFVVIRMENGNEIVPVPGEIYKNFELIVNTNSAKLTMTTSTTWPECTTQDELDITSAREVKHFNPESGKRFIVF